MKKCVLALISVILLSGCATIVDYTKHQGAKQRIYFTTPTGEQVKATIDNQKVVIPASLIVSKDGDAVNITVFSAENPGFENYVGKLSNLVGKETSPGWWSNVIGSWFSTTGSTTDNATGSSYQYSSPTVTIPLNKK